MFTASKTLASRNILTVTVLVPGDVRDGKVMDYFSVTAEERNPRIRTRDPIVACGTMHDTILKHWPDLRDVVALHLATADGAPMHAESNGWYWLAGAVGSHLEEQYHGGNGSTSRSFAECQTILGEHLRLSARESADMVNTTHTIAKQDSVAIARANYRVWLEDLAPRWLAEAQAAIAKYRNA